MGVQIQGDTGNVIATKGTYSGNVTIGGTLTYEDVTNVDSIGLVTARNGIEVGASPGVAASISVDGNAIFSGITTIGGNVKVGTGITLSPDGDIFFTGIMTGDGSNLTGIAATANVRTGILDVAGVSTFRNNVFQPSGRIVRGSTSTIQDGDAIAGGVNITGTDMDASVIMSVFGNDNDFNRISGAKSRNATVGSHTIIQDGDSLLQIKAFGSDGTNFEEAAYIDFKVDGVPGDNDMPGRIQFYTTADGASSGTERVSIDKNGDVSVKTGNLVIGTSGKGIDFSAASGSASGSTSALLDDYEEGTYTPFILNGFDPSIASNTGAYSVQNGYYRKIGTLVEFNFYINIHNSQRETDGGHLKVSLPFTQDDSNQKRGHGFLTYNTFTALNVGSNGIGIYIYDSKAELYSGSTAVSGGNGDSQANRYLIGGGLYHAA